MHAAGSGRDPAGRELDGLFDALDHRVVVALAKAHGVFAEHVDGGDHLDGKIEPHVLMLAC